MKKWLLSLVLAAVILLSALGGTALAANPYFADADGHWCESSIVRLTEQGIIRGYPDGTIRPEDIITRNEFAALVAYKLGLQHYENEPAPPSFADSGGSWAENYIETLVAAGVIEQDYYGGFFQPAAPISRIEMARMLVNALGFGKAAQTDTAASPFADDADIRAADKGYVNLAYACDLIYGYPDNCFAPENDSTRAEAFAIIDRYDEAADKLNSGQIDIAIPSVQIYIDPARITLSAPEYGYTDMELTVETETAETRAVLWSMEKMDSIGEYAPVELGEVCQGGLADDGGTIRIIEPGSYRLMATALNRANRPTVATADISIYAPDTLMLAMPEITHTDTEVEVAAFGQGLDIAWALLYGDEEANINGELAQDGGLLNFPDKGSYTVEATGTNALGRQYQASAAVTVYPVPVVDFSLPEVLHTDDIHELSAELNEMEDLSTVWSLTQNGEPVELTDYVEGELADAGGPIRFVDKGAYTLTANVTDEVGRTFIYSSEVTVHPVPVLTVDLPQMTHTDRIIAVSATGVELEGASLDWQIADADGLLEWGEVVEGNLTEDGGSIRITNAGVYYLCAHIIDQAGREFYFPAEDTIEVLPVLTLSFSLPGSAYVGDKIQVRTAGDKDKLPVVWSITKDGQVVSLVSAFSGALNAQGGDITFSAKGTYILTATMTDALGRSFSHSQTIKIYPVLNCDFTMPSTVHIGANFNVTMAAAANTDGKTIAWSLSPTASYGGSLNNNGGAISIKATGSYTLTATLTDDLGKKYTCSRSVNITNKPPTTPVITRTPSGNSVEPGKSVTITATSTDPDGDSISYIWENRAAQTQVYPLGKQVVRVKAVDAWGAESPWAAIVFFVSSSAGGGGMTLTGPESTIIESGIEGATITEYTFTVPPVSGHNGSDYGQVWGYNINTKKWDELNYGTTNNGITLSGTMQPGIYSQLKMYYYTNHDCMYNKSNITYSVTYYFDY